MPSWSPDGKQVYFVRTVSEIGTLAVAGRPAYYLMTVPERHARSRPTAAASPARHQRQDPQGQPRVVLLAAPAGGLTRRQDARAGLGRARPDQVGRGPPDLRPRAGKKSTIADVAEIAPLGHQDPAWQPDGTTLLYVRNGRDGPKGAPAIYRYDRYQEGPAADRPGLPRARLLAGRASTSPRPRPARSAPTSSILDASRGTRAAARHQRRRGRWAPVWSPKGDAIAFLHIEGQIVDLRMAVLGGSAPDWTVTETKDLTEVSGLDGASRPDWFIPASELPAADAAAPTPVASPEPVRQLERARASDRAPTSSGSRRDRPPTGTVLCLGLDPDPAALPDGLLARPRRRRAVRDARRRGGRAVRRRDQAEPRVLRGVRVGRDGRPRTDPRPRSRPTCRSSSTPSAATSGRPPPARPSPSSTAWAPTRSRSTRTSAREAIAPLLERADRFAYVLCRTSNPGAAELQDLVVAADPSDRVSRPSRSTPGRPAGRDLGAGRDGRAGRRRRRRRPSSRRSGRSRRAWRSSSRASAPRAARRMRSSSTAGRARPRPAGGPAAGCWSTCRGASRAPPATAGDGGPSDPWSASRQPPPSGPQAPCATLARAPDGPPRLVPTRRGAHSKRPSQEHDDAELGAPRAHHHPGHRAAGPRPGQAARGRRVARQEHQGIPQGVDATSRRP